MDISIALREQFASASWLLDQTMEGVTPEVFRWRPPGALETIADNYLHTVVGTDQFVHGVLLKTSPLVAGAMAGKTGLSSIPGGAHGSEGWNEWVKSVQVDLPALRAYAKAVDAAIASYLGTLKPGDLDRPVDLASYGLGVDRKSVV